MAWPKNKQKLLDLFSLTRLPGAVRGRGRIWVQVTERGQEESEAARGERGLWAKGEQGRQAPGLEGWGPGPGVYHRRIKLPYGVWEHHDLFPMNLSSIELSRTAVLKWGVGVGGVCLSPQENSGVVWGHCWLSPLGGGGYWYPVSRGQGFWYRSFVHRTVCMTKNWPALTMDKAMVERPWSRTKVVDRVSHRAGCCQ